MTMLQMQHIFLVHKGTFVAKILIYYLGMHHYVALIFLKLNKQQTNYKIVKGFPEDILLVVEVSMCSYQKTTRPI